MILTPEYLSSLRKSAEHMRDHGLVLQDVRGEVTLALLDKLKDLEAELAVAHKAPGHSYAQQAAEGKQRVPKCP